MTEKRIAKIKDVVRKRQQDVAIILENVKDYHNIGAVLRTCESVGVTKIFLLNTMPSLQAKNITLGKRTTAGTRKWMNISLYNDVEACFAEVRKEHPVILATHLTSQAKSLFDLNLKQPIALLFGNESKGVTPSTLAACDGNFVIPQEGFVESLNISVACAISLYELYRQRKIEGLYDEPYLPHHQGGFVEYQKRNTDKVINHQVWLSSGDTE